MAACDVTLCCAGGDRCSYCSHRQRPRAAPVGASHSRAGGAASKAAMAAPAGLLAHLPSLLHRRTPGECSAACQHITFRCYAARQRAAQPWQGVPKAQEARWRAWVITTHRPELPQAQERGQAGPRAAATGARDDLRPTCGAGVPAAGDRHARRLCCRCATSVGELPVALLLSPGTLHVSLCRKPRMCASLNKTRA